MESELREQLHLANLDQLITEAEANDLRSESKRFRGALELIASYDKTSKHGDGICPYGCDTPNIARQALAGNGSLKRCTHAVPASGTHCPECNASRLATEFAAQLRRGEPLTGPQKYVKGLAEDLLKQCEEVAELKLLIGQLASADPCRFDHHGYCQEHMWAGKGECAHGKARKILGYQ